MRGLSVVIVEDANTVAMVLKRFIESRRDWQVVGRARDCDEARNLFAQYSPDVVTLDLSLPGCDAFELLSELTAKDIPVVVVSGSTYEGSPVTAEAIGRGAEACFDKVSLRDCVESFLCTLAEIPLREPIASAHRLSAR